MLSKHFNINSLWNLMCDAERKNASDVICTNHENISDEIERIAESLGSILSAGQAAYSQAQRMEDALNRYKDRIAELEKELEDMTEERDGLQDRVSDLEEAAR